MKRKNKRERKRENYLKQIYYTPSRPASFGGVDKLYQYISNRRKYNISREDIKKWLQSQEVHSTNLLNKYYIKRRQVIVPYIDYMWEVDTASMRDYSKYNNDFGYFVILIDIMSRYVWGRAVKTPKGEQVKEVFKDVFKKGRQPERIRSDKGTEFTNKEVQSFLKDKNIKHFVTQNEVKANYVERSIRTIKGKIMRYMRAKHTKKWVDQLQNIINSYNNTYHRSIKQTPNSVDKKDENKLWELSYSLSKVSLPKKLTYKFNIGDIVRISRLRQPFQRYYNEHWTNELFIIRERNMYQYIPTYQLTDYAKDLIEGIFYENELQKAYVDDKTTYNIEKIIKERMNNGVKESLIRWMGWPKKFDSWIPSKSVKKFS